MALGTTSRIAEQEDYRLGTTIHYRFLPESFDPRQDPLTAQLRISQAVDIAIPVLEAADIPCELPPPAREETEWYQEIVCSGPGGGTEPLRLGWRRRTADLPWSGEQFSKTEYARNFGQAHIAFCEALMALVNAGLVAPDIDDEGRYLPDRNPERMDLSHRQMVAMIGAIGDVLHDMNVPHNAITPGGGVYEFMPDRPGPASDADTEKAVRRLQQAVANIQYLGHKPA